MSAQAQNALRAGEHHAALGFLDKALVLRPDEPRITDAYARAVLATGDLYRAETWAQDRIDAPGPISPSVLTTVLTTSLVASTRRKMIALYGKDWAATVKSTNQDAGEPALRMEADVARRFEDFINRSSFAAHKISPGPLACPVCGEDQHIIRRNRVALTNGFHLYFDLNGMVAEVLRQEPEDAGALHRVERVLGAEARANPDYFSVGLCECGDCGIAYVDHPFNADQVDRYYASQARAFEIGGQPMFARAHAFDWVRTKAAPIAYLRERLDKPFTGLTFLDAGCAEGIMCALVRLLGAEVSGVEPNARACRYAHEILNLEGVVEGVYGDQSFSGRQFDIVLSHHTMEHALNPETFARRLAEQTAPGGCLLLQVPCADTPDQAVLRGMGNFHLFGFRRAYLETLLGGYGLNVIESHHLPAPMAPPTDQIDPVTGEAIWGEHISQISILCMKETL